MGPGGSHRTPSHPVEDPLDPLQIGTAPSETPPHSWFQDLWLHSKACSCSLGYHPRCRAAALAEEPDGGLRPSRADVAALRPAAGGGRRQCSNLAPILMGTHRNAPLSPMKRVPGYTIHIPMVPMHLVAHNYGSYAPCRANSSTEHGQSGTNPPRGQLVLRVV